MVRYARPRGSERMGRKRLYNSAPMRIQSLPVFPGFIYLCPSITSYAMMRRVVAIALLLVLPVLAFAQSPVRFGIKAGIAFPHQTIRKDRVEIHANQSYLFGFHAGGELLVNIPITGLEVELDALLSRKGSKYTTNKAGEGKVDHSTSMYYLDFPLKLNYFIGFSDIGIYAGIGPTFSCGLFGNQVNGKRDVAIEWGDKPNDFSRFDMALSAQVGMRFRGLQANVFYDYGVYNTSATKNRSVTNRGLGISIGYLF